MDQPTQTQSASEAFCEVCGPVPPDHKCKGKPGAPATTETPPKKPAPGTHRAIPKRPCWTTVGV